MSERHLYGERQLAEMERGRDPAVVPTLVDLVRGLQRDLERLELSLDVARRDREELRAALVHAREEIARLRGSGPPG